MFKYVCNHGWVTRHSRLPYERVHLDKKSIPTIPCLFYAQRRSRTVICILQPFINHFHVTSALLTYSHRYKSFAYFKTKSLRWRHNGHDGVSNHQPHDCLLNRLFRSKKTQKLRVTGICAGNSPVSGEFPAQMASNAENVSIWWCHHVQCFIDM